LEHPYRLGIFPDNLLFTRASNMIFRVLCYHFHGIVKPYLSDFLIAGNSRRNRFQPVFRRENGALFF
jgi:hypothetical protein